MIYYRLKITVMYGILAPLYCVIAMAGENSEQAGYIDSPSYDRAFYNLEYRDLAIKTLSGIALQSISPADGKYIPWKNRVEEIKLSAMDSLLLLMPRASDIDTMSLGLGKLYVLLILAASGEREPEVMNLLQRANAQLQADVELEYPLPLREQGHEEMKALLSDFEGEARIQQGFTIFQEKIESILLDKTLKELDVEAASVSDDRVRSVMKEHLRSFTPKDIALMIGYLDIIAIEELNTSIMTEHPTMLMMPILKPDAPKLEK